MAARPVPINPALLDWAIRDAGVTTTRLAEDLDIQEETISAWLTGEDFPTTGPFRKVAKRLDRPVTFFFQSEAPSTNTGTSGKFRRFPSDANDRPLLQKEHRALKDATRLQRVISGLRIEAEGSPASPLAFQVDSSSNPIVVAAQVRFAIEWSVEVQVAASSTSQGVLKS